MAQATKPVEGSGTIAIGDRRVHRLGFGAMRVTGPGVWGPPADREQALAVLRRAVDLGVDLIDTADSYGPYVSEELINEALSPYPEQLVVATKAGLVRTGPGQWHPVGRPEYLRQECEMSLRRLGVEAIDLFQLHRVDPAVDAEEQFGVLRELRDEGKVKEVGLSNVSVDQVAQARRIVAVATVQNRYNLTDRAAEDVVAYCEEHRIGFLPWFPISAGTLAGPDTAVAEVARQLGATSAQVALAWLLHHSPVIAPIPGTGSLSHLEENCAAGALELTSEQVARLEEASR